MQRRGFFQTIAAAIAGSQLVASPAQPETVNQQIARTYSPTHPESAQGIAGEGDPYKDWQKIGADWEYVADEGQIDERIYADALKRLINDIGQGKRVNLAVPLTPPNNVQGCEFLNWYGIPNVRRVKIWDGYRDMWINRADVLIHVG